VAADKGAAPTGKGQDTDKAHANSFALTVQLEMPEKLPDAAAAQPQGGAK
jgi:hypothetical protein